MGTVPPPPPLSSREGRAIYFCAAISIAETINIEIQILHAIAEFNSYGLLGAFQNF